MAKQTTASEADQTPDNSAALEKQLAEAIAQIEGLKTENGQLKAQAISLTTDRDTLAQANKELAAEIDEKAEELAQAEALIEEQSDKLAAAEVSQAEGPVIVTHDKVQYRVLAPKFSHHGLDVDAHTLRNNPDLVRQLVEDASGLLQKVEAK